MLTRKRLILWWTLAVIAWASVITLAATAFDPDARLGMSSMSLLGCAAVGLASAATVWAMICTVGRALWRRDADFMSAVLERTIRHLLMSDIDVPGGGDDDLAAYRRGRIHGQRRARSRPAA